MLLFFLSGFSALTYQIVWQRTLFATFGINIESVTIIVSLFMFGLGLGALLGARLERYSKRLLQLFIVFELCIGLFGLVSRDVIIWMGGFPHIDSLWSIALYTYAVFAFPTLLMGATLPLLVSYINQRIGHMGKSMGMLYASNTFGAAAASFVTVTVFFRFCGLHSTLMLAVALNVATALLAFMLYRRLPLAQSIHAHTETATRDEESLIKATPLALLLLSFLIGYVALSQELIWYRVLGFLSANNPVMFGLMLACFLIGVADSSIKSRKAYVSQASLIHYLFSHMLSLLVVWIVSFPLIMVLTAFAGRLDGILIGFFLTGLVAYLCGGIFPVLCHLLQRRTGATAGSVVGKMYFANVMGATVGPLLTGFVLFEYCSLQTTIVLVGALIAGIILFLAACCQLARRYRQKLWAACLCAALFGGVLHQTAYGRFWETLQFGSTQTSSFEAFSSNRSGIIGVLDTLVFGNGAYDGKMNLNPYRDTNGILRAYAVPVFHPAPKRILLIGVSGGSWTQVLSFFSGLEKITAVEINKGYLDIIRQYPDHRDMLANPKVELVIDDGRRWVRNHADEKFDVIVMNTIYHWRSNATNMLSQEFFELCRQRLNPGGYVFINNTGAQEVAYTAAHVFRYVSVAFEGRMVIAGDTPSRVPPKVREQNLGKFIYPDGQPVFAGGKAFDELSQMAFPDQRSDILRQPGMLSITDDNMATEFKK